MFEDIFTGKPKVRMRAWTWTVVLVWLAVNFCGTKSQNFTFHLVEESSPPTEVGRIPGTPNFVFVGSYPGFTIDSALGVISTSAKFDRDTQDPVRNLRVRTGNNEELSVQVVITDINDNAPTFLKPILVKQILENAKKGSEFPLDTASDQDAGLNGTVGYSIAAGDGSDKFRLGVFAECSRSDLCLITNEELDRETRGSYQLKIVASDKGTPPLQGHCLVNITILDYNDKAPVFSQTQYNGSIAENSNAGASVVTVKAEDLDEGTNAEVRYSLESSSAVPFKIDEMSGVITCDSTLDHEAKKSYNFEVVAEDRATPPLRGKSKVHVFVEDVNEFHPEITVLFPKLTFPEDAVGHRVALLSVEDRDSSQSVNVTISSGNELGHFQVRILSGIFWKLTSASSLDREKASSYNLTIEASDNGNPRMSAFESLIVTIEDVNDNSPTFARPQFSVSISELEPSGTSVIRMNASDADLGTNSVISYSLLQSDLNWFQIDSTSGIITTAASLDRETHSEVLLTVIAEDQGSPQRNGSTLLNVTLLDGNDLPPEFGRSVYNASLAEGEDAGSGVIILTATDKDIGDNGRVTYEIESSVQEIIDSFAINLTTGELFTKVVLDREKKDLYDIGIIAKDHGKPQHSTRTIVRLIVTDVNDNRPVYYPVVYYRTLPMGAKPQDILKVSATDVDLGHYGTVLYEIAAGNDDQVFSLNQTNGIIRTVKDLTTAKTYQLNLTAKDGGGLTVIDDATAHITVLDNRDHPPVFKYAVYNYSIYENVPRGTVVGSVFATTNDSSLEIRYSIVSGDPTHLFTMNSAGGIIKVAGSVDREEQDSYQLGVVAQVALLSATASVNVVVLDENDNIPKFPKSFVEVTISGHSPVGKMVYSSRAVDIDAGLNGIVKYQLIDDGNGHFVINTTSGDVRLASPIVGRDGSLYDLKIRASDLGSPPRHALLTLRVQVFTNHPPRFAEPTHTVPVSSNLPLGKQFHVVVAIDSDQGDNGVIQYSIAHDGNVEGLFGIFADGSLYIKKPLSQATQSIYDITIIAEDKGKPPLNATAAVNVIIQDSTEHGELFSNSTYRFSIPENCLPGKRVGFLKASAGDPVKTMGIVYSFVSHQQNFVVDPKTGEITTLKVLDREAVIASTGSDKLIMQAAAVYNDTKVTRDRAIVVVQISDLNDNLPAFSRQFYQTLVMEDSVAGTVVFRFSAVDPDSPRNAEVVYSIKGGTRSNMFTVNATTGVVLLEGALDRESTDVYDLTIEATDVQDSSLFSETHVEIRVGDMNDNKPSFGDQGPFTVRVSESWPVRSALTVMNATDRDLDINAELMYSISSGNLEGVFTIDRSTGAIILAKTLDYEDQKSYKMNITVKDQGTPVLFARTELVVMVTDENDNRPVFDEPVDVWTVDESVGVNHVVGRCRAHDEDSGLNGTILYSIQSQVPDVKAFRIDPQNCTLYTVGKLDREVVDEYKIVVRATDQALRVSSRLVATKELTVQVEDSNDNKPRFVSPLAALVSPSISSGAAVMKVSAEDPDQGSNGQVAYTMGSSATFELVAGTGELKTKSSLNNLVYTIPVTAKDNGATPQRETQAVVVFKEGSGGPVFTESRYVASVVENADIGRSLLTVLAQYSSPQPNAQVTYFVTADNSKRTFGVDQSSGEVSVLSKVDYESPLGFVFTLKVFAVDSSGPAPRTSSADVEITVTDENDNKPVFTVPNYQAAVGENSANGVLVTSAVSATDKDSGENKRITYSITGGNSGGWFAIDPSTGAISTTAVRLDREAEPVHRLNITAEDHGSPRLSSSSTVTVLVQDVDDNAPEFGEQFYAFGVYEDAGIGAKVGAVSALDADAGANAVVSYHLQSSDVFDIDSSTGVIRITGNLDRETEQLYILNVSAVDGGSASSFIAVYVSILDRNDNPPSFTSSEYSARISEDAAVGSSVLSVSVTDPDHGSNADVSYNIVSGNNGGIFSILPNGTIVNSKALDREKKSSYLLEVSATDQAQPISTRLSRMVYVRITVADVNDNTPLFASKNVTHVSEAAQPGDVAMAVLVVDFDAGSNSDIAFSLRKIDPGAPFSLGSQDGILRVSGRLDRENRDVYSVEVTATDQGNPDRSATQTITVVVDDFNDHAPVFRPHDSVVKIREDTAVLTDVLRLSATDGDLGANAEVRFGITSGNTGGAFYVNPISGTVEVAKPLDRESLASYSLKLTAYDLGIPQQSADTTVTVELLDVNDNPPAFEKSEYQAIVLENHLNSGIITVFAKDPDVGTNGQITYEIISGDSDDSFEIDQNTGEIGLKKKLDREAKQTYTLGIKATDRGQEVKLSGLTKIVLTVRDENDNSPTFYPDKLKASVLENEHSGTEVVQVSAVDPDDNGGRGLVYSLDSDAPEFALFKIDSSSGVIVTQTSLDHERESTYKLTVHATDRGNPSRTGTASVDVTVKDVNDNDPRFDQDQYDITVEEGAGPGSIVFALTAADDDSAENALSSYSITNNSFFGISSKTGIITALKTVTPSGSPFTFTVKATNQASPYREDSARLRIQVTQGPFPHFLHPEQSIRVSELAPAGSKILKLNATGHTKYQIAAGNTRDRFDVDVEGNLKVKNTLDYGVRKSYDLVIEARDGSSPPKAGYLSVAVSIIDKNNNPPIFSKAYYLATVQEEQPSNQTVIWVSAKDADAGSNAETRYSIVQQGSGFGDFGISPQTGRLFTAVKLNREAVSSYRLRVRAEDVMNPSLSDETTVQVTVSDVNDNAPVFQGPLAVTVIETAAVGAEVISLTAVDKDEGSNAALTYDFARDGNPGGLFNISSIGEVTLGKRVDHEQTPVVILQVTASDALHVTLANLTVDILDVNDNPPEFLATPYIGRVDERSPVGTPVMNASAFDADTGSFAENIYSILPSAHSELFTIERKSGVIKLAQVLVYHRAQPGANTYRLTVKARNVWSPFFEKTVAVVVQVDDINDHAPQFLSDVYAFYVTKGSVQDSPVGRVTAVDQEDGGDNAVVRYVLAGGNGTSLFSVSTVDGRITTARNLQASGLFHIKVQAKDLGVPSKESFVNVFIDVAEINAASPRFTTSFYTFTPNEDVQLGSAIGSVTARDSDAGSNGQVTYAITSGNDAGYFGIGLKNGSIYTAKALDFDTQAKYHVNVTATDGGHQPRLSSATALIKLTNQNDNPPVFRTQLFQLEIAEGALGGTEVGKVSATDPDGLNAVSFAIETAEMKNFFSIEPSTGLIRSKVVFDYEARNVYEMVVVADDTKFSSRARVRVSIAGVNEFSPRFHTAVYNVAIAENAPPGSPVTTLNATDQDNGPDAELVYLLVRSSDEGFSLDPRTGVLSVSGSLDSEKRGLVRLEAVVKNMFEDIVSPDNSDLASIVVTVTDANDVPRFLKNVYRARILESAGRRAFVANVTAVDDDALQLSDANLVYDITQGNVGSAFQIDSATGVIRTAGSLDRETHPQYKLTVSATDGGIPPLSGYATVVVDLDDVNDNPPVLVNCTGHVRENRQSGSPVTDLQPTDPDVSPNQGPFNFAITANFAKFKVEESTGKVSTTAQLDRELQDKYNLSITISDNGDPKMSAVSYCLVIVDDENDNPPRDTGRIVHVTSFDRNFAGGPVGDVRPEDVDLVNSMTCKMLSSSAGSPAFSFSGGKCELDAPAYADGGEFTLKVKGSDGKATVDYDVVVKFLPYTGVTLNQSVVLRLKDESPERFLQKSYQSLLSALSSIVPSGYTAQILSVESIGGGFVNVVVSVQRDNNFSYLDRDKVAQLVRNEKGLLEAKGKVVIADPDYTVCTADMCLNQAECTSFMKPSGFSTTVQTIPVILHSVNYTWHYSCLCKRGFSGRHCESVSDPCSKKPCKNQAGCQNIPGGYRCNCKPGFTGRNCEAAIDYCTSSPCLFNSTCSSGQGSFQCKCDFGGRGERCERSSLGFDSVSYMMLPTLSGRENNNVTLQFATSQQRALLFYNADGQYEKDSDFIALEIIEGKLRFSFNLGEVPVGINSLKSVADGQWHTVVAVRKQKVCLGVVLFIAKP